MKFFRDLQEKQRPLFEKGGKLERLYPIFEAQDTFLFTPGEVTDYPSHVRDAADMKRIMITVVVALLPIMLMAMFNTGYQAHLAIEAGAEPLDNWRTAIMQWLGLSFEPGNIFANFVHGALYFVPVYVVTALAGGIIELIFCIVRKHEVNEGFLVTSALLPLTLPATIPLWQVALGIIFGVLIGKEVFGGTGMNIWNPALTARAFLYFAYPAQITGDAIWVPAKTSVDTYSGATWLAVAKENGMEGLREGVPGLIDRSLGWWQSFIGLEPGSMGETSALLCLIGAIILIVTKVGSWRTMAGCMVGSLVMASIFNGVILAGWIEPNENMFNVPFWWHWVMGGFAFAIVYMATDPVSSAFTETGKWYYGIGIGVLGILIRVVNPAFPGSWMLAILFMNMFAPLIDYFVVQANIKRRAVRYAA
jgi:Na+-transporting NADH:ubiquinone oxidoreductase subunit B